MEQFPENPFALFLPILVCDYLSCLLRTAGNKAVAHPRRRRFAMRRFSYRGLQRNGGWRARRTILGEELLMKRESKRLNVCHLLEVDLSRGSSGGWV
jgi:hypothetical protein